MVFNSNKGFFLTLDDAAAPATLELPQQEAPATEEAPVEAAVVAASEPSVIAKPSAPEAVEETVANQCCIQRSARSRTHHCRSHRR